MCLFRSAQYMLHMVWVDWPPSKLKIIEATKNVRKYESMYVQNYTKVGTLFDINQSDPIVSLTFL